MDRRETMGDAPRDGRNAFGRASETNVLLPPFLSTPLL